jgi:hypothetical protein
MSLVALSRQSNYISTSFPSGHEGKKIDKCSRPFSTLAYKFFCMLMKVNTMLSCFSMLSIYKLDILITCFRCYVQTFKALYFLLEHSQVYKHYYNMSQTFH